MNEKMDKSEQRREKLTPSRQDKIARTHTHTQDENSPTTWQNWNNSRSIGHCRWRWWKTNTTRTRIQILWKLFTNPKFIPAASKKILRDNIHTVRTPQNAPKQSRELICFPPSITGDNQANDGLEKIRNEYLQLVPMLPNERGTKIVWTFVIKWFTVTALLKRRAIVFPPLIASSGSITAR